MAGQDIGFSAEESHLDGRISFRISETINRDLLDGRRILHPWQLDGNQNWSRSARFRLDMPNPEGVSLLFEAGALHSRRPAAVLNRRLQLGYPTRWGETNAFDLGIGIGLLGNRLRYEGGFGRSAFRGTVDYRSAARRPERWPVRVGTGRGQGQRHRLDVDILAGEPTTLSAFARYERADTGFRPATTFGSVRRGTMREFGAAFSTGDIDFDITHLHREDVFRTQQKLEGRLGSGAASLTLFQDSFVRSNVSGQFSQEDTTGGSFGISLARLRGDSDSFTLRRLAPSSLRVGMQRGRIRYASARHEAPDRRRSASIGASWTWDGAMTDVAVYRGRTESPPGSTAGADVRDHGLDLSQSFYGETWDVTGYVSVGGYATSFLGLRSNDRWALGGISLSLRPQNLPPLKIGLEVDHFRGDYGEDDVRERQVGLEVGLDLSRYAPPGGAASMSYYRLATAQSGAAAGRGATFAHALSLTFSFEF